jgi:hypothetical protein
MSYLRNLCEGGGGFAPSSVQHILTIWVTWWLFYERHEPPSSTAGFTPGFMRGMSPLRRRLGSPLVLWEAWAPYLSSTAGFTPGFMRGTSPLPFVDGWFTPGFMRGTSPLPFVDGWVHPWFYERHEPLTFLRRLGSPLVLWEAWAPFVDGWVHPWFLVGFALLIGLVFWLVCFCSSWFLCARRCQFFRIVHSCLPLRFSLTFVYLK